MTPVKSSHIKAVDHDPVTNTLHVQFKDDTVFHYEDVSAEKHAALMAAKSVGKHFHAHINGQHKHKKVDD